MNDSDPARKAWPLFALFVLVGLGLMTPFALQAILDYRIACVYQQTECEILGERTFTMAHSSALGGRWVEAHHAHTVFRWAYQVQDKTFSAEGYDNHEGIMTDEGEMPLLKKGDKHACWYDPAEPEKSVLVRRFRAKFYLGALIPGSFILLGGFFLRGAFRRKPQKTETFISQGERLRYRLAPAVSTQGVMGCLGVIILALGLFIVVGLPNIRIGQGSSISSEKLWVYFICCAIEGYLIYWVARAAGSVRVPDPVVEIDINPLVPSQTASLFIRQKGPARLASFQVQITCEKVGPNGTRVAHKHMVVDRAPLNIAEAEEFDLTFTIPAKAAPSVKTVQTATSWFVRVRRKLANSVSYDTDYPFSVVSPGEGDDAE